jgi:hypothetical protein
MLVGSQMGSGHSIEDMAILKGHIEIRGTQWTQ